MIKLHINELFPDIRGKKVVVWGTGSAYTKWAERIEFANDYFIEGNPGKWGAEIEGKYIFDPSIIMRDEQTPIVIIMSSFSNEIVSRLTMYNVPSERIITFSHIERYYHNYFRNSSAGRFEGIKQPLDKLFFQYKSLLSSFKYKGIDLASVLSWDFASLLTYLFVPEKEVLLFTPKRKEIEFKLYGDTPIIVSNDFGDRQDHRTLINAYFQEFQNKDITMLEYLGENLHGLNATRSFIFKYDENISENVSKQLKQYMELLANQLSTRMEDVEMLWLTETFSYYISYIDFLEQMIDQWSIKLYCCFIDHFGEQNAIVQLLKRKGIPTIFLQHGSLPYFNKNQMKVYPVIYTHYNHIADTFLIWGGRYREHLNRLGIVDNRIIVLGNSKYNFTLSEKREFRTVRTDFARHYHFIACLSADIYNEYSVNLKLIEMARTVAEERGFTYTIKLHPLLNWSDYTNENIAGCTRVIKNEMSIPELLRESDFALASISTVLVESYVYCTPAFILETELVSDFMGVEYIDGVKDSEELLRKIDYYSSNKFGYQGMIDKIESIGNENIEIADQRSSERYKAYLNSFVKK